MGGHITRSVIYLLFMLLYIPALALANTDMVSISELRQQAEAMGRWTKTYEAHGRTIEVDVPIIVPEVEKLPVVEVEAYYAIRNDRLNRENYPLKRLHTYDEKEEYKNYIIYEETNLDTYLNNEKQTTGELRIVNSETGLDNTASLEDAVANLEKIIGYFYPGEPDVMVDRVELRSRLHKVKGIDDYDLGDYVEDYPSGTYNLSIREMMDGIPIYVDVGDRLSLDLASDKGKKGVNDFWRKNVKLWRVKDNYFEFMNKSRFELDTAWLKRVNKIEEDVPLQNVDVIINNLEKEIEKGKIRKIYALKLGYCVYFSDEGKNIYTIYPVWMCECDYTESAKEELKKSEQIPDERKQYYYKQLVINAQTGQIEPYLIKKQELAYCPRVITWEEVH